MPLNTEQQKRLDQVTTLYSGAGNHGLDDACVMQAVDWVFRNEDHFTAAPTCTPRTLRYFAIRLNDSKWPSDKDRTTAMLPLIPLLVGADPSVEAEKKRMFLFADFAVREAAPYWFDVAFKSTGLDVFHDEAEELRGLPRIVDSKTAKKGTAAAAYAAAAYAAAAAATYAAAYAATYAAAYAAAYATANAANAANAAIYAAANATANAAAAAAATAEAYATFSTDAERLPILRRAAEVLGEACRITS